jgi:cephalosporin hydroxylase
LKAYAPLVDVGSYLIVQDTGLAVPAGKNWGWANMAVDEFLAVDDRFEIDHERERLVLTSNPRGFLRRVR